MVAKIKINVKYPCGYEIKFEFQKGIFDYAEFDFDEEKWKICPLHGKECSNKY